MAHFPGLNEQENTTANGSVNLLYTTLICLVATLGGFLFGYDLYMIASAMVIMKTQYPMSPGIEGFSIASAFLGCATGPFLGARLAERYGRKFVLMITAAFLGIGALGTALHDSVHWFNIFRFIGGVGVGLDSVVAPMYIAEIAPRYIRGRLVTLNQLAQCFGCLASVLVSWLLAHYLSDVVSWRWMFASILVPVILLRIGLWFIPESPRWLARQGKHELARAILKKVNGAAVSEDEYEGICTELSTRRNGSFRDLFGPSMGIPLLVAVHLCVLSQFTGATALSYYAPSILQSAGFASADEAIKQTVYLNMANILFTVLALWLVERMGRRPLLLIGMPAMAVGMLAIGAALNHDMSGRWVLVVLTLTIGAYAMSLAPLGWLIMSEIFPGHVRGLAMALAASSVWVAGFITNSAFPTMREYFSVQHGMPGGVFYAFALVCVYGLIFIWRYLPETRGRTIEEIGKSWEKNS